MKLRLLLSSTLCLCILACSNSETPSNSGASGGSTSASGGAGQGGSSNKGGATSSGGSSATGSASSNSGGSTGSSSNGGGSGGGGSAASSSSGAGGTASDANASGGTGGTTRPVGTDPVSFPGCSTPAPAGTPVALHGQLKVVGTKVQDQYGQPTQLKGISSYWLNWENQKTQRYAESKPAMLEMRDKWKMQIFRAAMGTEASGGYIGNETAMGARIDTIVQNALDLGVYVILDWHTERAVDQTTASTTFFGAMAKKYGACPNLIYEDYNEPTKVTWAQIKPYHEAVVKAIRDVDPDNLIVLGTPNWSQDVDLAAADPVTGTNLLYTLHWYSCSHKAPLREKGTTAISKGLALFVSEFGATGADGGVAPNNTVCEDEGTAWFKWMADNGVGGTAWKLSGGTDSSNIFGSGTIPPIDGPFPDSVLSQTAGPSVGHGQFIINWIRQ